MEPDRAPALRPDLHELARQAADSHQVIVETIAATTTRTGPTVQAALDTSTYQKGIKISDNEMKLLEQRSIRRHGFHGEWKYTLLPAPQPTHPTTPK
jgi:hypothetical protein